MSTKVEFWHGEALVAMFYADDATALSVQKNVTFKYGGKLWVVRDVIREIEDQGLPTGETSCVKALVSPTMGFS